MPLYTYECQDCGDTFDKQLKVDQRDEPCGLCAVCGEEAVLRVCANAGFQLKGNCWSRDNYARNLGDDPRYKAGTRKPTEDGR